jgi:hypothetical protein
MNFPSFSITRKVSKKASGFSHVDELRQPTALNSSAVE